MRPIKHSLGAAVLALAAFGLQAEDFQPLMKVTEATWVWRLIEGRGCMTSPRW